MEGVPEAVFLKLGTIFEDSPIGFDKWLPCLWMVANSKNGISSHEWRRRWVLPRRRLVHGLPHPARHENRHLPKAIRQVEFDEAYIGGNPENYSKSKRKALAEAGNLPKGGSGHKTAIVGAKQRNGDLG